MSNASTHRWDVEVCSLWFHCPTLRTSHLDVTVEIGPGVDIGWISSATVSLFYGHNLIGEMALENEIVDSNYAKNSLFLEMGKFEIQDMIAFKSFVRGIMPKPNNECQSDDSNPTAKLELVEKGHTLNMAINLHGIGSFKTTTPLVRITGMSIKITFTMWNTTAVEIHFEDVGFDLKQDDSVLAFLTGDLNIEVTGETGANYTLNGSLHPDIRPKFCGKAILTVSDIKQFPNTWFVHAIREFRIEVDLDKTVVCELD